MKESSSFGFSQNGGMAPDIDPRLIQKGAYIDAENIYLRLKNEGTVYLETGTALSDFTLPLGTNIVLKAVEDTQGESVVFMVRNSLGVHSILRWYRKTNSIVLVAQGPYLAFSNIISSALVIDGRLLLWTDGVSDDKSISGNEPRMLDMERSALSGKMLEYCLFAGISGNNQFASPKTYTFFAKTLAGATLASHTITATGIHTSNPAAGLEWIASSLLSGPLATYIYIEVCDCKLSIKMKASGRKLEFMSDDAQVLLVPDNFYAETLTDMKAFQVALKREPLSCAPIPEYVSEPTVASNNVRDGYFQFRSRLVFYDGTLSPWSEISITPLNNAPFGDPQQNLNAIKVMFTDARLNDKNWLSIISGVEIAFRDTETSEFRLVKRLRTCEIGSVEQSLVFLNDQQYQVVASDDFSVSTQTTQVLSNYFPVPRISNAISGIADDTGNFRIVLGGNLNSYDCPDCIEGDATPTVQEDAALVDIRGVVEIVDDPRISDSTMRYPNYTLGGFVVYLAGTDYYAISDNPIDGSGTGEFIIRNVPKGVYSMRVASYMCRFDNDLGPRYNLNNGRIWQTTSSPVIDVAGALASGFIYSERVIDLYSLADGATLNLETEPGYGNVRIQNCHHGMNTIGTKRIQMVECYVLDNEGTYNTVPLRTSAAGVGRRNIEFPIGDQFGFYGTNTGINTTRITDHNGYCWDSLEMFFGTNTGGVRPVIPTWGGNTSNSPQPYQCFASANYSFLGENGWEMIYEDSASNLQSAGGFESNLKYLDIGVKSIMLFVYNSNPAFYKAERTTLSGFVKDADGRMVAGALVWMMGTQGYEMTDANGLYKITTYGTNLGGVGGAFRSADQKLFVTYLPDTGGDYPSTPSNNSSFFVFDPDADGVSSPYSVPDFTFGFKGGIQTNGRRYVKSGGIYKVGILYEDDAQRTCGVAPLKTVRVPFHTADGQHLPRSIDWSITSAPPIWATRYRIVVSKDSFYDSYIHLPAKSVLYGILPIGAVAPTIVSYGSGSATHIMLEVGRYIDESGVQPSQLLVLFDGQQDSGYKAKVGDRVRYMLDETQSPVFDGNVIDVPVVGEYLDGTKYYVVIPYTEIQQEVKTGWVFEFFTAKGIADDLYYSTGICLPIIDSGLPTRRHTGIYQNQTPSQPATGPIRWGDTYWWRKTFNINESLSVISESQYKSRYVFSTGSDIGRPAIVEYGGERFDFHQIIVSGVYVPISRTNNLNAFGVADVQNVSRAFGPIKFLGMVHDILLCICQAQAQPIYVGKGKVIDLSGNSIISRASSLLTIADETVYRAGTLNPESVVVANGRAYWWDLNNATMWRYAGDGITDISAMNKNRFMAIATERRKLALKTDVVVGGYDPKHDYVFMSFQQSAYDAGEGNIVAVPYNTLALDADTLRWASRHSWWAESFAKCGDTFLSFYGGKLYRQFEGTNFNVHGSEVTPSITFVVNDAAFTVKNWHYIMINSLSAIQCPLIYTLPSSDYPSGMKSLLKPVHFSIRDGIYYADFLKDMSDPHANFLAIPSQPLREATASIKGRPLKGDCLVVKLTAGAPNIAFNILGGAIYYSTRQ